MARPCRASIAVVGDGVSGVEASCGSGGSSKRSVIWLDVESIDVAREVMSDIALGRWITSYSEVVVSNHLRLLVQGLDEKTPCGDVDVLSMQYAVLTFSGPHAIDAGRIVVSYR